MNLKDIIELGVERVGSQRALAEIIHENEKNLSSAKAGKRGLTTYSCAKLAEITGIDPWQVKVASDLNTEKNPEVRDYLAPFVQQMRRVAMWATIAPAALVVMISGLIPARSEASQFRTSDTLFVSHVTKNIAAQGAENKDLMSYKLCEAAKTILAKVSQKAALVRDMIASAFRHSGCMGLSGT